MPYLEATARNRRYDKEGELNDKLINRLCNWKFKDAYAIARNAHLTEFQRNTIKSLNIAYGDIGWFTGCMGDLVSSLVNLLTDDIARLTNTK